MRAYNNLPQPNPYILVFGGCGRLLHTLTPPRSAFLYLQFLAWCHPCILLHFYTCIQCRVLSRLLILGGKINELLVPSTPACAMTTLHNVYSCSGESLGMRLIQNCASKKELFGGGGGEKKDYLGEKLPLATPPPPPPH